MFWLQPLILGFAKLSLLHFCRRIFSIFRSFQIVSMVMIVLVWGFMICFTIGLFFDCGSNIAANWGSLAEIGEQCTFGFLPTVIYTIIDAAFDLACLLLPIPWVWIAPPNYDRCLLTCHRSSSFRCPW
jgi:flagellar biosynthesis protein FlhB